VKHGVYRAEPTSGGADIVVNRVESFELNARDYRFRALPTKRVSGCVQFTSLRDKRSHARAEIRVDIPA